MWEVITALVDSNALGGWVRAFVASVLAMVIAKLPWLADIMTPELQGTIGVVVSGLVVGFWSHLVKLGSPAATLPPTK